MRPRIRRIILPLTCVLLAAFASGCGGSDADPEVAALPGATEAGEAAATTSAPAGSPQDALVSFTRCLRDEGLDVPDPDFDATPEEAQESLQNLGFDPNDPRVQEAIRACQPLLVGILQTLDPETIQGFRDAIVSYAACMREQGVDLPDPDFSRGLDIFGGAVDPSDPAFQEANEECSRIFGELGNPFEGS